MYLTLRNSILVPFLLAAFCAYAGACVNLPPVAEIANPDPTWVHVGYQLCFNGEPSYDDDEIVSYRWRFGDGATTGWKSGRPHNCDPCDPYRTKHAYSSVGNRIAILDVKDRQGLPASHSFFVYVCSMSWSADSYVIPVNDDDDDEDGVMDNKGGSLPGDDDDLVPMLISDNSLRGQPDVVSLGIIHDTGGLQVWDQKTRTGRLIGNMDLSKTWPAAANWSETVYVEGMHASSGQDSSDPKLRWDYFGHIYAGEYLSYPLYGWSDDMGLCQKRWTVVHVDMDMPTVADDWTEGGDMMTEETMPGGFIPLEDFAQLTVRPVMPALTSPSSWRNMTLDVEYRGNGRVQIWDEFLYAPLTLPHPCSPTANTTYYVEGYHASSEPCDITLVLTHVTTGFKDRINLTVVGVDKIEYKIGLDDYQDCPSPLAVAKGADVTFKAIKSLPSVPWPAGKPVWSGSSGASGTGEEEEVAFDIGSSNPTDYKVVRVECGNIVSVNVVVVDLSTLVINANRTSAPVEASFPIKAGEHFELGGTFKFDLMLNAWPTPVKLGAEVWDLDYINEVIASGPGASISHTFGTGGHDDGTCDVCFYFDNNTSGDSRTGSNDPQVDSYDFEVQELTYHYLTFGESSAVAGTPDTGDACRDATDLILRKDTADDYRATAKFIAAGLITIPASTHDPVYLLQSTYEDKWGDWSYFRDYDSSEVIIVEDLTPADAQKIYLPPDIKGISKGGVMYDILIDDSFFIGEVLAHEVGHSCGLGHNTSNQDMIMFSGGTNRTLLTESDASGFE
jgi:hypothetical protein